MRILQSTFVALVLVVIGQLPARADIGLLLNAKPNDHVEISFGEITGEGHSAVYLSRICAASPVELRLCRPGEPGSVIQSYENYEENQPYEWNVVPLSVYLYGVDDMGQKPLFASPQIRTALQERYREKYLAALCTTKKCISDPNANWRDAVAAAFVREIYIFKVSTTVEQDEEFIREWNARANVNHYSGFVRNCADFSKLVVNTYFPHSAHRDVVNDFGMTGPKAIARSFAHYAEAHPELELHVIRIDQLPGTYKRSSDCHEGTEQTFRSKKWLIPVAAVEIQAVPVLAASYMLTGRFDPNHELREHPSTEAGKLEAQLASAKADGDKATEQRLARELQAERRAEIGGAEQWREYRERFDEVLQTAIDDGIVSDRRQVLGVFRKAQKDDRVYLQDDQLWLEVKGSAGIRRVGLSSQNIFSPGSDRQLAMELLLARTNALLSVNAKHRELLPEFASDWLLLERAEQLTRARPTAGEIASRRSARE